MGYFQNKRRTLIFSMIITFSLNMVRNCRSHGVDGRIANFVFGDSLADVGNNNYIDTYLRANMTPNGIDFGRPTGRYTNGYTILDMIAHQFGSKISCSPPYLDPSTKGRVILQGVNYASGGSGILNETGRIQKARIPIDAQLDNFANTIQQIKSLIGEAATKELLNKAFYPIVVGSNDFLMNFLLPRFLTIDEPYLSAEEFVGTMITKLRMQLTRLYNMGARTIVVVNVGPIGCMPFERTMGVSLFGGEKNCSETANQAALLYDARLRSLITELRTNLKGSFFLHADVYRIFNDIVVNYRSYGFESGSAACCSLAGPFQSVAPCGPKSKVCSDRSKYVFWDSYHPSQAANVLIAKRLVDGDIKDISPINFRQLFTSQTNIRPS